MFRSKRDFLLSTDFGLARHAKLEVCAFGHAMGVFFATTLTEREEGGMPLSQSQAD
jgi:hypothetical protein